MPKHITHNDAELAAIRDEYAEEEAEAAEAEIAERTAALDVPLNLRISRALDDALRHRAAAERIAVSALVRRLLADALRQPTVGSLEAADVEAIARRVVRDELLAREVVRGISSDYQEAKKTSSTRPARSRRGSARGVD